MCTRRNPLGDGPVHWGAVTYAAIRQAVPADLAALAWLRREQAAERMPRPGRSASYWGDLANAFVLAAYRDQGIGRQLLDAVLGYASQHDLARVLLSPSERSVPFYQRAGFGPADTLLLWTP
jgi:GNAT superfamily N-acetyltransferase